RLEIDIEERCVGLLALRQPMAVDLRFITAALKISNDLERMGDHAVNIATCSTRLAQVPPLKPLVDIPRMADMAAAMLRDALDAFVRRDAPAGRRLCQRDDAVDNLNRQLFRELISFMMEDPTTITRAMDLILVARNLERVADLATNVAEEVVFIAEARIIKHHVEEAPTGGERRGPRGQFRALQRARHHGAPSRAPGLGHRLPPHGARLCGPPAARALT